MRTKTFRIGESSYYGIWKLEVNDMKQTVKFSGIDWNSKQVKEVKEFNLSDRDGIREYADEQSTSYYGGQMVNFIFKETNN